MPVFSYKAITSSGASVEGKQAADSIEALRSNLASSDLLLQSVKRQGAWQIRLLNQNSVSQDQFLLFTHELISLLNSGMNLPAVLKIFADRPDQQILHSSLQQVLISVNQGQSLSEACRQFPEVFDRLFIASVNIGENSGDLVRSLKAYQVQLETRIRLFRKIKQALAYPLFLGITLIIMLAILFMFVLPRFISIYASFGSELPLPTQLLIVLVSNSHIVLAVMIIITVIVHGLFKILMQKKNMGLWIDKTKLRLPYIGSLLKTAYSGQTAGLLATLLNSGIPLVKAMNITADSISNRYINYLLLALNRKIEAGMSLSESMTSVDLYPDTSLHIIQAGEASGNIGEMLNEVAAYHEHQVDYRLSRLMSVIEPLMMLLMGLIVGSIIFVMYLPIFNVAEIIQ